MTTTGSGTLRELVAGRRTDFVAEQIVGLERVAGPDAVLELLPDVSRDEGVVFVFAHDGLVGLLNTTPVRWAPCPACVLYHLATGTDVAFPGDSAGWSDSQPTKRYIQGDGFEDTLRTVAGTANHRRAIVVDPEDGAPIRDGTAWKHPACTHEAFPGNPEPDASLSRDESVLRDSAFGLVRRIEAVPGDDGWTGDLSVMASLTVNPAHPERPDRLQPFLHASGGGESAETARLRATMEGLERCAAIAPDLDVTVAAEVDLGTDVLPPTEFFLYSDDQYAHEGFPCPPYDPAERREWVRCEALTTDEWWYVPADLVRLLPDLGPAPPLVRTTTSGCAAQVSTEAAVRNGIMELLERDAVLRHWYTQESHPRVRTASLPTNLRKRVQELDTRGYDVYVVDATRYPPFVCIEVFLVAPDEHPAVVSAASCDPDPTAAVRAAFREAADIYRSMAAADPPSVPAEEAVTGTNDHLAFYQQADRTRRLQEWLDTGETTDLRSTDGGPTSDLVETAHALSEHDIRVRYVDITPEAVAAYGGRVVRVLSPDLLPITFGRGRERLVNRARERTIERATDLPHPFA